MNTNISVIYNQFITCENLVIDTRKIEKNSIFLALKGDKFDANTFCNQALELGAKYVILDNQDYYIDERTIIVENSLETLQELAKYHREQLNIKILVLTGSNGKTTTKELIYSVLSQKYNCKATFGNLNNHIGVPLTLLSFDQNTEIGIVEMGANHQKEIEFLCNIAKPDFGYITNFGKAHLEGFGGLEGVIKGKSEMYEYLMSYNQTIFINLEDEIQVTKTNNYQNKYTFGINKEKANINFDKITCNPFVKIELKNIEIQSKLIGIYNSSNINAAITIGDFFEVPLELIKKGIESYQPDNNRSQILTKKGFEIILDAYNANPTSMVEAIKNFNLLNHENSLMILGDMFEMGNESRKEHQNIINIVSSLLIKTYFIGEEFYKLRYENENITFFNEFNDLKEFLKTSGIESKFLLIKGSRGMALERVLEYL